MPELTSLQCGARAFGLRTDEKVTEFTMRSEFHEGRSRLDLPKLTTFTNEGENSDSFSNLYYTTLESCCFLALLYVDMPNVTNVVLSSFIKIYERTMNSSF